MNYESVATGLCSILIIGAFHPLVIKCEYYFSDKVWPAFLIAGLVCLAAALFTEGFAADILALFGAACLWSVHELKEQKKRVEKGWFPDNKSRNRDCQSHVGHKK